jgi:uncharacterized repeat protein (TIGR01451 family)
MSRFTQRVLFLVALVATSFSIAGSPRGTTVTFLPYIMPGDNGPFGATDQMLVAWQTDEANPGLGYSVDFGPTPAYGRSASPTGRPVDQYLSADPVLSALSIPTAYGPHSDYAAVLAGLAYDTEYFYRVSGPGLPPGGFHASFHTRKRGNTFTFQVMGDEGFFPGITGQPRIENWEARTIHTMYHAHDLSLPGEPRLPRADLTLVTGDNVYTVGSDANYRDFWMGAWNSDIDSNDHGAPFLRHRPLYIVIGNHDVGATGASANLLADSPPTTAGFSGPGRYGGGVSGGDALAHFNNFYYPLNGPMGVDIQQAFNGDLAAPTGMFFTYLGTNYASPGAIEAYRASTTVDSGKGPKRQIDHMSNYSVDYGNAHFIFLDANPHLFNQLLPPGTSYDTPPSFPFSPYPSILRDWLIQDLDGSAQTWKVAVFHQPTFSSGNATLRNDQMRWIAKFLEDHGVNIVFNGHEHNYQRTRPIRTLPGATASPGSSPPAVAIDPAYDGKLQTVPDGVLYIVEGAGGDRDFDNNFPNPRGSGTGIDQDDDATGSASVTYMKGGMNVMSMFPNGPDSWLDTNLTNTAMVGFLPGAGSGPKITVRFKSKIFSFGHVVVDGNRLTLYQVSEPLGNVFSGTFGTDLNGNKVNDPLPDTLIDPTTGEPTTTAGEGTSVLLDKWSVTKPDLGRELRVDLKGPKKAEPGESIVYTVDAANDSDVPLNGAQVVLRLPKRLEFVSTDLGTATVVDRKVVVTLGRFDAHTHLEIHLTSTVDPAAPEGVIETKAILRSSTALPAESHEVKTHLEDHDHGR